jgi:hypothetical protein
MLHLQPGRAWLHATTSHAQAVELIFDDTTRGEKQQKYQWPPQLCPPTKQRPTFCGAATRRVVTVNLAGPIYTQSSPQKSS